MKNTVLQKQKFIDNLIAVENEDGKLCRNTFELGLQAIIGENVILEYKDRDYVGLIPRVFDINYINNKPDIYAYEAIKYLKENFIKVRDSYTWHNDYEVYFRDEKVLDKGWSSSFGQAYIILAFIYWYKLTDDKEYLNFAINAAKYYLIPMEGGGILNLIDLESSKNLFFFEELPSKNPTHILNAHLISLIALNRLSNYYSDDWIDSLITSGTKTMELLLPLYNTGYWSRYDIPNKLSSMFNVILNRTEKALVKKISFKYDDKEYIFDENTDFDSSKKIFISGIDWGMVEEYQNVKVRKILSGSYIRNTPADGGLIQNSYINMNLDNLELSFLKNSNIDIEMEIYTPEHGELKFDLKDSSSTNFGFNTLFQKELLEGWNSISFSIPLTALSYTLSDEYHNFHIDLLNILYMDTKNSIFKKYFELFLSYKIDNEFKSSYLPFIDQFSYDKKLEVAFISVNSVCGLNCIMCDIGIKDTSSSLYKHLKGDSKYNMTTEDFLKILKNLEGRVRTISFIGTEALLNKNIFSFITMAKEHGFYVTLTTNGINLENNVKRLVETNLDEIWYSIDGILKKHDTIRGRDNLFDSFEKGIMELDLLKKQNLTNKPLVNISSTIIPSVNEKGLLEFVKYFEKYSVDNFSFNHMNFVTKYIADEHNSKHPQLFITESKYLNNIDIKNGDFLSLYGQIQLVKTYAKKYKKNISFVPDLKTYQSIVNYYIHPNIKLGKKTCTAPWSTLEIDPKGQLSIAARCFQVNMGNIINQSFEKIWKGEPYVKFRENLLKNESYLPCNRCCGSL